jgi:hypothetical protein
VRSVDDLILKCVVRRDRVDHSLWCVDRNVGAGDDLAEPGVVVGVRVRHKRSEERLSKGVEPRAHLLGGRDLQEPVNSDDPRRGLDQVGIDECALVL